MATLEELEDSLEGRVTGPFKRVFVLLMHQIESVWPGDDASLKDKQLALSNIDLSVFNGFAEAIVEHLLTGAESALAEGFGASLQETAEAGVRPSTIFRTSISAEVNQAARSLPDKIAEKVKLAQRALATAETLTDAQASISVAGSALTNIRAVSTFVVNKSINDAAQHVSDLDSDLVTVWEPERDACTRCLNRAGERNPKRRPPEHPHCRCRLRVLEIETSKAVSAALKREADRSILRGWSRPSESEAVRLDAARKLLAKNPNMPKSVKDYARNAIKRGGFPRGRNFPGD